MGVTCSRPDVASAHNMKAVDCESSDVLLSTNPVATCSPPSPHPHPETPLPVSDPTLSNYCKAVVESKGVRGDGPLSIDVPSSTVSDHITISPHRNATYHFVAVNQPQHGTVVDALHDDAAVVNDDTEMATGGSNQDSDHTVMPVSVPHCRRRCAPLEPPAGTVFQSIFSPSMHDPVTLTTTDQRQNSNSASSSAAPSTEIDRLASSAFPKTPVDPHPITSAAGMASQIPSGWWAGRGMSVCVPVNPHAQPACVYQQRLFMPLPAHDASMRHAAHGDVAHPLRLSSIPQVESITIPSKSMSSSYFSASASH